MIILVIATQSRATKMLNDAFRQTAHRHDGRFIAGTFFSRPSLRFVHRGANVLVDTYSTGGKHPARYTQMHLSWPESHLRITVYPEGVISQITKFLGTQDIQIGSPTFDREYIIQGNNEELIIEKLTPEVQARINALRRFRGNNDIYVGTVAGTLLIKKRELTQKSYLLDEFILLGLGLYDDLVASGAKGIEFLESREQTETMYLKDTGNAICQICGEAISEDSVLCKSCKTPHHAECWAYYGACSMYGCGQTRYLRPRR